MKPVITFIVPVYNGSAWVERCLNSLSRQSFRDFEILVIDDGSTDDSLEKCEAFAQNDPRITLLRIPHGGLSRARNMGLANACGQYIGFLDIDDWIEPEFAQTLLNTALTYKADIVSCYRVPSLEESAQKTKPEMLYGIEKAQYGPRDYLALEYRDPEINVCMGNKLYARRLFMDVQFPEGELYEDVLTNYKLCRQCKTIIHVPAPMYHYFVGDHSITRSPLQSADFILPTQWSRVRGMAATDFSQLLPLIDAMRLTALRMLASKYCKYGGSTSTAQELKRLFRQSLPTILCSKAIPVQKKLRSLAAMVSLAWYGYVTDFFTSRDN